MPEVGEINRKQKGSARMTFPGVEVVNYHNNNEKIEISTLTKDDVGMMIHECKELIDKLQDAFYGNEELEDFEE